MLAGKLNVCAQISTREADDQLGAAWLLTDNLPLLALLDQQSRHHLPETQHFKDWVHLKVGKFDEFACRLWQTDATKFNW